MAGIKSNDYTFFENDSKFIASTLLKKIIFNDEENWLKNNGGVPKYHVDLLEDNLKDVESNLCKLMDCEKEMSLSLRDKELLFEEINNFRRGDDSYKIRNYKLDNFDKKAFSNKRKPQKLQNFKQNDDIMDPSILNQMKHYSNTITQAKMQTLLPNNDKLGYLRNGPVNTRCKTAFMPQYSPQANYNRAQDVIIDLHNNSSIVSSCLNDLTNSPIQNYQNYSNNLTGQTRNMKTRNVLNYNNKKSVKMTVPSSKRQILEEEFRKEKYPSNEKLQKMSAKLNMRYDEVQNYFKKRRREEKEANHKFSNIVNMLNNYLEQED